MAKYRHVKFEIPDKYNPFDVAIKYNSVPDCDRRILFVVGHVPQEDLRSRRLFSGTTGAVFDNVVNWACEYYNAPHLDKFDYTIFNYNAAKTYGKKPEVVAKIEDLFQRRLEKFVAQYKPTHVVAIGESALQAFMPAYATDLMPSWASYIGTELKCSMSGVKFKLIPTVNFTRLLEGGGKKTASGSMMLGYVGRSLMTPLLDRPVTRIKEVYRNGKPLFDMKWIKTIKQFDKFYAELVAAPIVAIDTEATSLNRVVNELLTIQFSFDGKLAYLLPMYHYDTPFSPKELRYIKKKLADYFENNKAKYHIFTNATFDLNLMRGQIGIRSYAAPTYDILAGEYVHDENLGSLVNYTKQWYFSLLNVSIQYGTTAYIDNPFGKENRHLIGDLPLSTEGLDVYIGLDVIVPFRIAEQQLRIAEVVRYPLYESMATETVGDQLHVFSTLEFTGQATDIDWLFKLGMPDSELNLHIKRLTAEFMQLKPVKKANKVIAQSMGITQGGGLFGQHDDDQVFSLSKSEHKQILFFDVMKLKPIKESKKRRPNGDFEGAIDKGFQEKYKSNPVVNLFTQIQKVHKIKSAFVKAFIRQYGENADFMNDSRMRPKYGHLNVVTGRTSASDPNLQQIPSREKKLAKMIKRLFIAEPGRILIKVDYSAHEVRGWSIISGDKEVAGAFRPGEELRARNRLVPDPLIGYRAKLEGDVHRVNASYFFGIPIAQVLDDIRQAVKTVIFGLIYQQGDAGLARSTKRDIKEIGTIKKQFLARFPIGYKWFEKVKNFAKKHIYVESPLGRRRKLYGLLLPKDFEDYEYVEARCLRQSVNSGVQGFCSDLMMMAIRLMDRTMYEHWQETKEYPDIRICVSVHDSVTLSVDYDWFWYALKLVRDCMTVKCVDKVKERVGLEFTSEPDIDMEIGADESTLGKWDYSFAQAEKCVIDCLKTQVERGYDIGGELNAVKDRILYNYTHMPDYMLKQLWIAGNRDFPKPKFAKGEYEQCQQWVKEIPANAKKLEKILAEEEAKKNKGKKAA